MMRLPEFLFPYCSAGHAQASDGRPGAARRGAVARHVDEHLGTTSLVGWLSENQQHAGGRHRYTLAQYGIDPGMVAKRFGPYLGTYLPEELAPEAASTG